jgi:hypothetical protein
MSFVPCKGTKKEAKKAMQKTTMFKSSNKDHNSIGKV